MIVSDTSALIERLKVSHGQVVHEFYSRDGKLYCDCAICEAADKLAAYEKMVGDLRALCDEVDPNRIACVATVEVIAALDRTKE